MRASYLISNKLATAVIGCSNCVTMDLHKPDSEAMEGVPACASIAAVVDRVSRAWWHA